MENKLGDVYNQVESDPRPVDNKTTDDAKQRSLYPYGEGANPWTSTEYYPPGWQERNQEKTKEPTGYIPHVLLRPEPVNMKEHLLKLREIIDKALKEYD